MVLRVLEKGEDIRIIVVQVGFHGGLELLMESRGKE
jgi:hypothetical protein